MCGERNWQSLETAWRQLLTNIANDNSKCSTKFHTFYYYKWWPISLRIYPYYGWDLNHLMASNSHRSYIKHSAMLQNCGVVTCFCVLSERHQCLFSHITWFAYMFICEVTYTGRTRDNHNYNVVWLSFRVTQIRVYVYRLVPSVARRQMFCGWCWLDEYITRVRGPGASPAPLLWVSDVGHGAEPTVPVRRPLSLP